VEKKYADLRSGIVIILICALLYFWIIPAQIKYRGQADINPDFFPRLLVICGALCGLLIALQGAFGLKKAGRLNRSVFTDPEAKVSFKKYLRQFVFLGSALISLFVMNCTGFIIASVLYLTFLLMFFGHSKFHWCLMKSVIFVGVVYLVFSLAFKISFPQGILGF
jgi:hypothetical protein